MASADSPEWDIVRAYHAHGYAESLGPESELAGGTGSAAQTAFRLDVNHCSGVYMDMVLANAGEDHLRFDQKYGSPEDEHVETGLPYELTNISKHKEKAAYVADDLLDANECCLHEASIKLRNQVVDFVKTELPADADIMMSVDGTGDAGASDATRLDDDDDWTWQPVIDGVVSAAEAAIAAALPRDYRPPCLTAAQRLRAKEELMSPAMRKAYRWWGFMQRVIQKAAEDLHRINRDNARAERSGRVHGIREVFDLYGIHMFRSFWEDEEGKEWKFTKPRDIAVQHLKEVAAMKRKEFKIENCPKLWFLNRCKNTLKLKWRDEGRGVLDPDFIKSMNERWTAMYQRNEEGYRRAWEKLRDEAREQLQNEMQQQNLEQAPETKRHVGPFACGDASGPLDAEILENFKQRVGKKGQGLRSIRERVWRYPIYVADVKQETTTEGADDGPCCRELHPGKCKTRDLLQPEFLTSFATMLHELEPESAVVRKQSWTGQPPGHTPKRPLIEFHLNGVAQRWIWGCQRRAPQIGVWMEMESSDMHRLEPSGMEGPEPCTLHLRLRNRRFVMRTSYSLARLYGAARAYGKATVRILNCHFNSELLLVQDDVVRSLNPEDFEEAFVTMADERKQARRNARKKRPTMALMR